MMIDLSIESMSPVSTLALGMPGGWEWLIIGAIGLLIFGRRLPEVGRSLGKGIVEFKRGIKGIEEDIESESNRPQHEEPRKLAGDKLRESESWSEEQRRVSHNPTGAPAPTESPQG